jgi:hypothetical protein
MHIWCWYPNTTYIRIVFSELNQLVFSLRTVLLLVVRGFLVFDFSTVEIFLAPEMLRIRNPKVVSMKRAGMICKCAR